jgi:hypothetical protein
VYAVSLLWLAIKQPMLLLWGCVTGRPACQQHSGWQAVMVDSVVAGGGVCRAVACTQPSILDVEVCSWGTLVRYQGAVMLWGSMLVIWVASGWDDCHNSWRPGCRVSERSFLCRVLWYGCLGAHYSQTEFVFKARVTYRIPCLWLGLLRVPVSTV